MLTFIVDICGAYLIAKHVSNIWLAVLAAILLGVVSAVGGGLLIHAWEPDLFSWIEIFLGISVGITLHPIVAIVSLLIFRRIVLTSSPGTTSNAVRKPPVKVRGMDSKYCTDCGAGCMQTMRKCPACGNKSFSDSPLA